MRVAVGSPWDPRVWKWYVAGPAAPGFHAQRNANLSKPPAGNPRPASPPPGATFLPCWAIHFGQVPSTRSVSLVDTGG